MAPVSNTSDNSQKSEEANLFSLEASSEIEDVHSTSTTNPSAIPYHDDLSSSSNVNTTNPSIVNTTPLTIAESNEPPALQWYRCIDDVDPFRDASVFDVDYRYTLFGYDINGIDSNQLAKLESFLLDDIALSFECKSSDRRFLEEAMKYPGFVGFQGSGSNVITDQKGKKL